VTPDRRSALVLGALFLWQALLLGVWLHRDTRPLRWDDAVHASTAHDYKRALSSGNVGALLSPTPRPGHPIYPPVVHFGMVVALFAADVTGVDPEDAATFLNALFLALIALGAFFLAGLWWGREAGLAAAFIAGLVPAFVLQSRVIIVDVALAAFAVWTYALWALSGRFSDGRSSLWLAGAFALGCLTKWSFPFYVLPVLADGVLALRRGAEARRNALRAAGLAALLLLPWYGLNIFKALPRVMRSAGQGGGEGDPDVWSLASWLWYPRVALWQVTWVGAAAALAGLVFLFRRRLAGRRPLLLWLLCGYVFWSLVSNKNDRYFLPVLPALALAAAALPKRAPWALAGAAVVFSGWLTLRAEPPRAETWPLEEIAREAAARRDKDAPLSVLTVLANHGHLNGNNMRWTVEKLDLDGKIRPRAKLSPFGQFTEFVVLKTGNLGPDYAIARQTAAREEALKPGGWFLKCFEEVRRWPLPDGSEAALYRRRDVVPAEAAVPPAEALPALLAGAEFEGLQVSEEHGALRARAASVSLKGLRLEDVAVEAEGFRAVRPDGGGARLLALRRARVVSAAVDEATLLEFLKVKAKNLKDAEVSILPDGRIEVSGRLGVPLSAALRLAYSESPAPRLTARIESLRVAGAPLPLFLLGRKRVVSAPLAAHAGMPFDVALDGLASEDGVLYVGEKS
jgi:uncharacterized membrane protein